MRTSDPSGQSGVLVLLGVLFTIILAGLDNTIVSTVIPVALPELGGAHMYAWTFAAYMLAAAVSMPIWGPGSDRWGRRRTYLFGIVAFTAGSALCAVARTMMEFIAARAIQGIGAGAIATLPFVLLGVVYPPHKRGRALGAAASAWAVASVAGPLLGTLIVTHVSWRWAFLINVPIAVVAAFLVIIGMHESVGKSDGRFDFAGALLAGAGGSSLMWAFVDLGEGKIGPMQAALIGAGIILLAIFVWHEGWTPHPILPLSFFHHAGYAASISSSFLAFFSGFGVSSYLPLATNAAFHENRAIGGLVVGAFTIGWSALSFTTGRLVHRIGERLPSVIGIVVHILGFLLVHGRIRTRTRLGRRRRVDFRRRHGVALACADRGGAKQCPGRAHGKCDDQPAIRPASRRRPRRQLLCSGRNRRRLSHGPTRDDRRQRRNLCLHPGAAGSQSACARTEVNAASSFSRIQNRGVPCPRWRSDCGARRNVPL